LIPEYDVYRAGRQASKHYNVLKRAHSRESDCPSRWYIKNNFGWSIGREFDSRARHITDELKWKEFFATMKRIGDLML
jgi:hypothetical protein